MVCGACVEKLALKLVRNHKVDWLRALELAEKGVERVENRLIVKSGNPTDYTQNCYKYGSCACKRMGSAPYYWCVIVGTSCDCKCPSPLPNSHLVTSHCGTWSAECGSPPGCRCSCQGTCSSAQVCDYDCDEGYEWNGEKCVLVAVPKAGLHPSKVMPIILNG